MVQVRVTIEASDWFDYLLFHTYNSPRGLAGSCLGAMLVVIGVLRGSTVLALAGLAALAVVPILLWQRSKKQVKAPDFDGTIEYVLDGEGIRGNGRLIVWEEVEKAFSTTKSLIVYVKGGVLLFPKKCLGDQKAGLIETISTHVAPDKIRIKE